MAHPTSHRSRPLRATLAALAIAGCVAPLWTACSDETAPGANPALPDEPRGRRWARRFHVRTRRWLPESRISLEPQKKPEADITQSNGKDRQRVLIVDDDASIGLLCSRMLEGAYETMTAESSYTALQILEEEEYDVLLSDIRMPDMDGFILSHEARRARPKIKVLLMTGSLTSDVEERLQASHLECEVIRKPFTANTLQKAIQRCS